jgi:hypothetical protein
MANIIAGIRYQPLSRLRERGGGEDACCNQVSEFRIQGEDNKQQRLFSKEQLLCLLLLLFF